MGAMNCAEYHTLEFSEPLYVGPSELVMEADMFNPADSHFAGMKSTLARPLKRLNPDSFRIPSWSR